MRWEPKEKKSGMESALSCLSNDKNAMPCESNRLYLKIYFHHTHAMADVKFVRIPGAWLKAIPQSAPTRELLLSVA
jgi:hypothetical protein